MAVSLCMGGVLHVGAVGAEDGGGGLAAAAGEWGVGGREEEVQCAAGGGEGRGGVGEMYVLIKSMPDTGIWGIL